MILNKPTTNPIRAKIAITAMTLSNEFLGFGLFISWKERGENQTCYVGSKEKNRTKKQNVS